MHNSLVGSLIDQGLNLMLFGMGTVFVFLTLLVLATTAMSSLVTRLVVENEKSETDQRRAHNDRARESSISPNVIKAIEHAIALHRQQSRCR